MSFSRFIKKDYELIDSKWAELQAYAKARCASEEEFQTVLKAYEFANEAHKNVRRRSGEPYIVHPIEVAEIVVKDIGLGAKSIAAALLHDVVEDTDYTFDDIKNLFGEKIALLVEGLTKIKTVLDNDDKQGSSFNNPESIQAENLKKILLTLNDDVRVSLIKLADRLHNCRTLEYVPEHKRDKILSETMYIFIPLAHRLGLYGIKSEMENIWLKYNEPDAYKDICDRIDRTVVDKDRSIDEFISPISDALLRAGFDFTIKKRIKTPYSIWRKMNTKNVDFDQVYDLYAVRIIFNPPHSSSETERDQCYHIFSIITGIYKYQPSRIRDWVKHPKGNGYEALHCTLMSQIGIWVEVQIRSKRMDDVAEKGIAAHWAYKKDGYISESDSAMDRWLAQVKEILEKSDVNSLELLDIVHKDMTSVDIVVFTPKGAQRTLIKGATALDFAYLVHTDVGNKAIAAKVNMKLVPLSHCLKSGDQVEIITAQKAEPKLEWLQFLQTRHARNQVIDFFKPQKSHFVSEGSKLFAQELHNHNLRCTKRLEQKVVSFSQLSDIEEFYFRLGLGLIPPGTIMQAVNPTLKNDVVSSKKYGIRANDPTGKKYVMASCCNPIPGDPVIGFMSPDGVITIHKKSCMIAENLASKFGDTVVEPDWDMTGVTQSFPARLSVLGIDRVGILNDITHYISQVMGLNVKRINLSCDKGIFEGYLDVLVHDKNILETVIDQISSIDGVKKIVRIEEV